MGRLAGVFLLGVLALVLAGCGGSSSPQTVTVTGSGTVTAVPDRLDFSFGVDTRAPTARAALRTNAAAAQQIVAALKAAGVAERDIQTEDVSVSPELNGTRIVDYLASTSVSAKIRQFDEAGAVLDAATKAGSTNIQGPTLEVSRTKQLYRVALRHAVADAHAKAASLAKAAGKSLGAVQNVSEQSSVPSPLGADVARGAVPKIEPGTQQIEASVTATYALG